MITIDYDKCCWKNGKCSCCGEGCEGCVEVCPTGALERKDIVIFHKDKCIDCGVCVDACNYNAISR